MESEMGMTGPFARNTYSSEDNIKVDLQGMDCTDTTAFY
jgi:hypothetical protein